MANDLVRGAVAAEEAGLDFVAISNASIRGSASTITARSRRRGWGDRSATRRVGIARGLTCPIVRYHPAILAQVAATVAMMAEGRLTLVAGAGERFNEHVAVSGSRRSTCCRRRWP